jgi:hypothetical protein
VLADRTLQEGRIEGATRISANVVKRAARALAGAQAVAPERGELHTPEPEPADTIDVSGAALSLSIGSERRESRRWLLMAGAVAVALMAGAGAYWYYASDLVAGGLDYTLPRRAVVPRPALPPQIVMPSDDELAAYFREMRGLGGPSGLLAPINQIPRDRDDLD